MVASAESVVAAPLGERFMAAVRGEAEAEEVEDDATGLGGAALSTDVDAEVVRSTGSWPE